MMFALLIAVLIISAFSRWGSPIVFGTWTLAATWLGAPTMFFVAPVFAMELVSAWTGEPWTRVVWRIVRPELDRFSRWRSHRQSRS